MHETRAITDLLDRMIDVCWQSGSWRVVRAKVRVGTLLNFTPQHLNEHFELVAKGTPAEGCKLDVEIVEDLTGPAAYQIVLESVDVA